MIQMVKKNLPGMWEIWVQSLSGEDSQEESRRATILLLAWPSELGELGCVPSLACLCLEGAKLERL